MIRIRVELVPEGDDTRARLLVEGRIVYCGGDAKHGSYRVQLSNRNDPNSVWVTDRIDGFLRSRGPWSLVRQALNATLGKLERADAAPR